MTHTSKSKAKKVSKLDGTLFWKTFAQAMDNRMEDIMSGSLFSDINDTILAIFVCKTRVRFF